MRNSGEQPPRGPHDETQGVHRTGGARISELDWQCCRHRVELRSWLKRVGSAHQTLSPGFRAHKPSYGTGGWRCPPGLFWRKAGKQDWLCVDSAEAQRIAHENEQAALSRTERPDGTATCHAGLVRREAFRGDLVCVKPLRQHEVRVMNAVLYTVR